MRRRTKQSAGQSTVEFGASALVLVLLLFGLIDLGRVFYFDVALQGAAREGARQATWFDAASGTNPGLDDADIKASVDSILTKSGLPASVLMNPTATCPQTSDGNTAFNPPYTDGAYPATVNTPSLYICYANTPGLDVAAAPSDNSLKGADVNVVLTMSFGFASGLLSGVFGSSIHIVANTHMSVGGY